MVGHALLPVGRHAHALAREALVVERLVPVLDGVAARRHARGYAFTIGAMGSRDQNFYNAAFERQGYGDDVRAVQDMWLEGRREEAADRVPIDFGRRTNLLGPPDVISERLRQYQRAGVTTLQAKLAGSLDERLATLAHLIELCDDCNAKEGL